jgi:hypothetical protein
MHGPIVDLVSSIVDLASGGEGGAGRLRHRHPLRRAPSGRGSRGCPLRASLLVTAAQIRSLQGGAPNRRAPEAQAAVSAVLRADAAARRDPAARRIPDTQEYDWSKQPVFELGVCMYELATGRYPFASPTAPEARYDDRTILPFDPPGVSPAVVDLVLRMLRWDPAARPDLVEVINVLFSPEHM